MQNALTKLKQTNGFFILLTIFIMAGAIVLLFITQGDGVLLCNENRTVFFNVFFKISTKIIEEEIMLFILFVLLWFRFGTAFLTALSWGVGGIVAQILKRIFSTPRPASFFQDTENLQFITERIAYHFSFPSGHTTVAFAIFGILALSSDKKWVQGLCFTIALTVGISRIYLLQHFFVDVYAGAILGSIISYLLFVGVEKYAIFGYNKWKNKSIRRQFKL